MVNLRVDSHLIENIDLVIFDKDGTLMDLYNYWSSMVGYRVELAKKRVGFDDDNKARIMYAMGVDCSKKRLRSEGPVGVKKREVVMAAMENSLSEIGFPINRGLSSEIFREADKMSLEHLPQIIRPVTGMNELIGALYKNKCHIAIATTDKTERAKLAAKHLGISDKVDIVVGEDMVKNYKPYPDMVDLILEKLSVDKNNAVMVGDAVTDIEMGNNAGLKASIAVLSGIASEGQFRGKTDYIVENISHINVVKQKG